MRSLLDSATKTSNSAAIPILEEACRICQEHHYELNIRLQYDVYSKLTQAYLTQSKYRHAASTAAILVQLSPTDYHVCCP